MTPFTGKLLALALATVLVVGGGGVAVAGVMSEGDDEETLPAIEVRKDEPGPDAELVEEDEEGDGDNTYGVTTAPGVPSIPATEDDTREGEGTGADGTGA